jgi:triosephosphate isomerase (TIM)
VSAPVTAPVFEIGPKNLLRRSEIEAVATAAGRAGEQHGVTVLVTVPTALVAPIHDLGTGVRVLAQGMHVEGLGPSMNRVTAEALVDAGADGVMLNHDADPLDDQTLARTLARAGELGLKTVVCAATQEDAVRFAELSPTIVLLEPPKLIGTGGTGPRDWVGPSTEAVHRAGDGVLAMHAGGVSSPEVAEALMAAGADGTGSTSGVLNAADPGSAVHSFIAATRSGWDRAHR